MYKLTIDKLVENPTYVEDRTRWLQNNTMQFNMSAPEPMRFTPTQALTVDLTPEEFHAVKHAVLRFMESGQLDVGI